jgi:high-affinity iron transporter
MFGVSLFILREVFEIALILTVIMAATRSIAGRNRYILGGIAAGVAGAAAIALFTENISNMADGMGQEMMNAGILILAAVMIGWTAVWMRVHGRELSQQLKQVGSAIQAGEASFLTLSAIIALAVFREGAEMILFSFGAHASGTSWIDIALGSVIGLAGGMVIGALFYFGMIKLFARHFLSITSILLALLAAGMAAKGIAYLAMIGMVPEFGSMLWDSSHILSDSSIGGESLGVLVGYTARPSGIQLVIYLATLAIIFAGFYLSQMRLNARKKQSPA